MSATLDRLMTDAQLRLPGVLPDAVQREVFAALDEFVSNSCIWQEDLDFHVVTTRDTYEIAPDDYGLITTLVGVVNSDDRPVPATMQTPGTIALRNTPSQADTYTATVVMKINDPTTRAGDPQFPSWILDTYREALLDGVLGRMMSQPAKPYSNERLGIYHLRRFRNGIATARFAALRQNLQGGQRWRFPQSFATRSQKT